MGRPLGSRLGMGLASLLVLGRIGSAQAPGAPADEFFSDAVLHQISLRVNSRDWQALKENFESNQYYPCDLVWNGVVIRNVGIRSRGFGSRSGTKPGLRVDIDRYNQRQEFLGLKSFVLDNLLQDSSTLKERLSFGLFRRLGLPAPRAAHARLYVNGAYAGLYGVVESIDKRFLARVFGADETGRVENGGYLFEYRWHYPYYFEYLGSDLAPYEELFERRTREFDPEEDAYRPLEEWIRTLDRAPDGDVAEALAPYVDLPLFMKQLAVDNFLAERDGLLGYAGLNNVYLYRFEGRRRAQFLPWDKDNSFAAADYPILQGVDDNVLARRAMAVPALKTAYLRALLAAVEAASELDPDDPRGWLEREVERAYEQVRAWVLADPFKPYSDEEFESAVEALRTFARVRPAFVRCEVALLADPEAARAWCAPPGYRHP
jgi:hypothetical protein